MLFFLKLLVDWISIDKKHDISRRNITRFHLIDRTINRRELIRNVSDDKIQWLVKQISGPYRARS